MGSAVMNAPARIPKDVVVDVLQRTDLAALAGRFTKLTQRGRVHVGLCPFHIEKTPSFRVWPDGHYHCFGCGAHGGATHLLMQLEGLTYPEAIAVLAHDAGVPIPGQSAPKIDPKPVVARPATRDEIEAENQVKRRKAYDIWTAGKPWKDTPVSVYLREARGIPDISPFADIRFSPAEPYFVPIDRPGSRKRYEMIWTGPAMLAAFTKPDGRFAGVHITWLAMDGGDKMRLVHPDTGERQTAKKMKGATFGSAIRLSEPQGCMCGGEGIETTLAGMAGAGIQNGMAAGSLDNLAGAGLGPGPRIRPEWHVRLSKVFPGETDTRDGRHRLPPTLPDMSRPGMLPPRDCLEFLVLGDGDTKDALMLIAKLDRAVNKLTRIGVEASWVTSPRGKDFNDMWREGLNADLS